MPALGIDPRTGGIIVIPDNNRAPSAGVWGPSLVGQERQRQAESYSWSDLLRIKQLLEDEDRAYREAEAMAENMLARMLLSHPYMGPAILETGISPAEVIRNPAVLSQVGALAFLKYQEDVKRAWQEGRGPLRPLTANEFMETIAGLANSAWGRTYFILDSSLHPTFQNPSKVDPAVVVAQSGPYYLIRHQVSPWRFRTMYENRQSFFPWATDDPWWLSDPDFQARFPEAAPGYGKVSPAPPGFQKVEEGIYEDPETGFLYFVGTGAYLGHGFLATWRQDRTLGKPVTNEFEKDGKVYQVFEGGILAYDPGTGEIQKFRNAAEAGLDISTVKEQRTSPKAWTSEGKEIPLESHVSPKTWTTDPYLGTGSSYYDQHPARTRLPDQAPSAYPYYGIEGGNISVTPRNVWITDQYGQFRQPDYWIYSRFIGNIRSNPELKSWYYSLSDLDRNQVFANYIATGQIYL